MNEVIKRLIMALVFIIILAAIYLWSELKCIIHHKKIQDYNPREKARQFINKSFGIEPDNSANETVEESETGEVNDNKSSV